MTRLRRPRAVSGFALIAGAAMLGAFGVGRIATDSSSHGSKARLQPPKVDGVYTYLTDGNESNGAHTHVYPAKTTITVTQGACIHLRWNPRPHRSTTWTLCRRGGIVTVRGVDETHAFPGQADHMTYACTQRALKFTCTGPNGSASGRVIVEGRPYVPVGGSGIASLEVEALSTLAGATDGTETTTWWFDRHTLLPLRIILENRTSHDEAKVGAVQYRENATLQLVSTKPQR